MRGLLDDLATRWSRERAAHSRCRGPIGAKTDGRVKIIKLLLSGFDTLDWTPPLLWLWQRRHDREVILCPSPSGLVVHAREKIPWGSRLLSAPNVPSIECESAIAAPCTLCRPRLVGLRQEADGTIIARLSTDLVSSWVILAPLVSQMVPAFTAAEAKDDQAAAA